MRRLPLSAALVVAVLLAAGCGGGGEPNLGRTPLTIDVPVVVVGELEVTIEEGPVGDDDLSEVNFGVIELDDGYVLVELWADVARESGLTRAALVAGGTFRVSLDRESDVTSPQAPTYVVAAVERLD